MTSLFGSAEVRVHLASGALIACEVRRLWGRTSVARKAQFYFSEGERTGAMDALAAWIAQGPIRRSIVWIIGPSEAQYFVLPWSPAVIDRGLRDAYARAHFERAFEQDAQRAAFYFEAASDDNEQLVSCVPVELTKELAAFSQRAACELAGIKPSIHMVWDRFREVLESEQGILCIVDGDSQAIVLHDKKRIKDVAVKPSCKVVAASVNRGGVVRRFSNRPSLAPATSPSELNLPAKQGFVAARDAAYSIALCGAL